MGWTRLAGPGIGCEHGHEQVDKNMGVGKQADRANRHANSTKTGADWANGMTGLLAPVAEKCQLQHDGGCHCLRSTERRTGSVIEAVIDGVRSLVG